MIEKAARSSAVIKVDYDRNAANYDSVRFGTPGGRYVDKRERAFVASVINGSRVLEIGTATGRFAVSLTNRGVEYAGIDLSQKMLRVTFKRTSRRVSLVQMDASRMAFRSYFDYVLCVRTFHFLPNPQDSLRGMFTALKPLGECLVTFETDNFFRRFLLFSQLGVSQQYYYKISDVKQMFEKAGLKPIRSGSVMKIPVTVYRKCPKQLLWALELAERFWPWSMHDYVLGKRA